MHNMLAVVLAAAIASPAPSVSPSVTQGQIPTIVTVISSPYCNSLSDHFNGALMPMLANDRVLQAAGDQLQDLNTLFTGLDYQQRFVAVRNEIGRQESILNESLSGIQAQISALRTGAALSTDAQATAQIQKASQDLQTAYEHQRQVSIDLQGLYHAMMDYNISRTHPNVGGFDPEEMSEPADMKNIETYLHFDSQRSTIAQYEDQAVDIAYNAAQSYCVPKK